VFLIVKPEAVRAVFFPVSVTVTALCSRAALLRLARECLPTVISPLTKVIVVYC
jgi:hypothetical protein